MNKLSINTADNIVIVDDYAVNIDVSYLADQGIRHVYYNNGAGTISFIDNTRQNAEFTSLVQFKKETDAHALVMNAELAAMNEMAELEALNKSNDKLIGFDYGGTLVSYTKQDRDRVMQSDALFHKKNPLGEFYISDTALLKIKFSNGSKIKVTRDVFNNVFLPQFIQVAVVEFL